MYILPWPYKYWFYFLWVLPKREIPNNFTCGTPPPYCDITGYVTDAQCGKIANKWPHTSRTRGCRPHVFLLQCRNTTQNHEEDFLKANSISKVTTGFIQKSIENTRNELDRTFVKSLKFCYHNGTPKVKSLGKNHIWQQVHINYRTFL